MHYILAASILACIVVSNNAEAQVHDIGARTVLGSEMPRDHLQPRDKSFVPRSLVDQAEQQRISTFDANQENLDSSLDRKLNICRC